MVDTVMTAVTTVDVKSTKKVVPIRGRPKSGRVWKEVRKPTHTLIKKKVSDKVWKEKMQLKRDALATQVIALYNLHPFLHQNTLCLSPRVNQHCHIETRTRFTIRS